MAGQWKWSKDPKPEVLRKLAPSVRRAGMATLKREMPIMAQAVVDRIRARGVIVKDGHEAPIPRYSQRYVKRLQRENRPLTPDYTRTGTMLDHLRGRIRVVRDGVEGRVSPFGRVASGKRIGTGKRAGMVYREPYTYTHPKTGATISVPGQWIKVRGGKTVGDEGGRRSAAIVYNAHLMNLLVSRKGDGQWLNVGIATHHILALTPDEARRWRQAMKRGCEDEAAEVFRRITGPVGLFNR